MDVRFTYTVAVKVMQTQRQLMAQIGPLTLTNRTSAKRVIVVSQPQLLTVWWW